MPSTLIRSKVVRRSAGSEAAYDARSVATCSWNRSRVAASRTSTKSQGWLCPTLGAEWAAPRIRSSTSGSSGSPLNSARTSRRRAMTS